jgi:hypothetical protein
MVTQNPWRFNNLWLDGANVSVVALFRFFSTGPFLTGLPRFFLNTSIGNLPKLKGKTFIPARYASSPKQSKQLKTMATVV